MLHAGLFLACGAVLLFVQYLAVNRILGDRSVVITGTPVPAQAAETGMSQTASTQSYVEGLAPAQNASVMQAAEARFVDFKSLVLDSLLSQSLITLAILAVVSASLGWWTAGRSLARLHKVTGAARRISEQNLHDRLALVGPDDEIKELGDTIDAMLVRLERSFDANRRFAANASHELRTPLALQRTSLEIPLAEGRVPDDLKPSIERALRATARSDRLVAGLLLLASGQQGPQSSQATDLADLAADAVDLYRAQAAAAGITVTTDLDHAPTSGDPVLLGQVAANLVQNAVRHNVLDREGDVRVSTGRVAGGAELRVDNTGPTVDPTNVEHLFEPFHRGEAARLSTGRPGSGLGLSIVRAVVESHGGTVVAGARATGGLRVTVFLPEGSGSE
ncbi:sensor histidine kinase [Kitasatospora sp. NPDC059795]|uniref:sensor histidine kinase n=1 Tax=Kitasatospora sp. NPDC059795 TaxID=3346949 RepID=UPI00364BC33B